MVGLVFSKLSRPQLRQKTVIFSTHAVVTLRNRKLCLIFRIGDLRDDNFILGTQVPDKYLFLHRDIPNILFFRSPPRYYGGTAQRRARCPRR